MNFLKPKRKSEDVDANMFVEELPVAHKKFKKSFVGKIVHNFKQNENERTHQAHARLARKEGSAAPRSAKISDAAKELLEDIDKIQKKKEDANKAAYSKSVYDPALNPLFGRSVMGSLFAEDCELSEESDEPSWFDAILILPESMFRQVWDVIMLVLILYITIYLPILVAFSENKVTVFAIFIDSLFLIDMIVQFISAYKNPDGKLVKDPKKIALNYLSSWFVLDLIATFPFYLIGESAMGELNVFFRFPRLLKILRLLRLLKLARSYRLKQFFEDLEFSPRIHAGVVRMGKLFFVVTIFGHFTACLWFFIGDFNQEGGYDTWIEMNFDEYNVVSEQDSMRQYLISLYWAVTSLTTVGFGEITGQTNSELVFSIFIMVTGATMFSYITATVSSVLHDFDRQASAFRGKMTGLMNFMRTAKLPLDLQERMMDQMASIWRTNNGKDVGSLREDMPRQLVYEVALMVHEKLIEESAFFHLFANCDEDHCFVGELVAELSPRRIYEGEFIGDCGEMVENWAIIEQGTVCAQDALDSEIELMWWMRGDSFGEIGIFFTRFWCWNMRCCENCFIYEIPSRKLLSIVTHHRSVSQKLVTLAGTRLIRIQESKKQALQSKITHKRKIETHRQTVVHHRLKHLLANARTQLETHERRASMDPDRYTAKGRWKWLRDRLLGVDFGRKRTFRAVVQMATEFKQIQKALNEIKMDMRIWKDGMTANCRF